MMPVYFIQDDGGEIKIGYSEGNPYRRLNNFRTGNPRELKLLVAIPGGHAEEQALHARFADLRGRGEWFKPDARLLGFIEGMKYAYKDAQPEPVAEDEPTLFGLAWEQVHSMTGASRAESMLRSAQKWLDDTSRPPDMPLSDQEESAGYQFLYELDAINEESAGDYPFNVGVKYFISDETPGTLSKEIREVLDQSHAAERVNFAANHILDSAIYSLRRAGGAMLKDSVFRVIASAGAHAELASRQQAWERLIAPGGAAINDGVLVTLKDATRPESEKWVGFGFDAPDDSVALQAIMELH